MQPITHFYILDFKENIVGMEKRKCAMKKEIRNKITVGIFSVLLFGLAIGNQLYPDKEFSQNENRILQKKPRFSVKSLLNGTFGEDYESYLSDQFIGRDQWITLKTNSDKALGKKEINGVYFAKDGYLIEKHTKDELDPKQYKKNVSRIKEVTNTYTKLLGKDHVRVMFAPTASCILRDKLPSFAPEDPQEDILNDLKKSAKKGTFVDLRPIMKKKKNEYIYYRTDHHWTTLGAYYAYTEWANSVEIKPIPMNQWKKENVSKDFLGTVYSKVNQATKKDTIQFWTRKSGEKYEVVYDMGQKKSNSLYERSYLKKKDKYSAFLDGNHALTVIRNKKVKNGKKLLIVKDSYAHSFAPFIASHFEEVHLIDLRYFNMGISDYVKQYKITDMLMLYHAMSYATDIHTLKLIR